MPDIDLRTPGADDIAELAGLIDEVSEGIIETLLKGVLPGMEPRALLSLVLGKNVEPYALENMTWLTVDGAHAGLLFAYDAALQRIPAIVEAFVPRAKLDLLRPILTASWPDALWVNTFWVSPDYRGQGAASFLMRAAEAKASELGKQSLALHCWAENARALRFYEREGFAVKGKLATSGTGGPLFERHPGGGLLLVKMPEA